MSTPIIEFEHVTKRYGENLVLDDISISIEAGEFVTLIGRSGCGKTTFLKMINALQLPDSGHVRVSGKDVQEVDQIALRRGIGYVIQNVGLSPHMNVRRNIEYVPHLFRHKPKETIPPERLMEIVSLEPEYLTRFPNELSGGQKQRVGIARAGNHALHTSDGRAVRRGRRDYAPPAAGQHYEDSVGAWHHDYFCDPRH